jgi:hypothetical protein
MAFAAYCAERLYPQYVALAKVIGSQDVPALRAVLDALWRCAGGTVLSPLELAALAGRVRTIGLGEEGCCAQWDGGVDAVGAALLAVEACRGDGASNAARAGADVLNGVEQQLMDELAGRDYVLTAAESNALAQRIDEHPRTRKGQADLLRVIAGLRDSAPVLLNVDLERLRRDASSR